MNNDARFVTMISCESCEGEAYTDRRAEYNGMSGLLYFRDIGNGLKKGEFYTRQDNGSISKLTTSNGVVSEGEHRIILRTRNSVYVFSKAYDLDEETELLLTEPFVTENQE